MEEKKANLLQLPADDSQEVELKFKIQSGISIILTGGWKEIISFQGALQNEE